MRVMCKLLAIVTLAILAGPAVGTVDAQAAPSQGRLLTSGLQGAVGATVGPDRALYVPEAELGRITRIDPTTGASTTFASGLPTRVIPLGGAIDMAFIGRTAYVLVTLVSPDVGGSELDGIYRIDGPNTYTVIADIGAWSVDHPPRTPFDVPTGLQFALEPVHRGFLVTDGHHNRVLRVGLDGTISEFIGLDNVVPTGLAVSGRTVYWAEAGPVPHLPETGKVVAFDVRHPDRGTWEVASGYSLMVDVEFGRGRSLYALSQGDSPGDVEPAAPALPDSGELLRAERDGSLSVVVEGLDRPTSVDFIGDTAFVVNLDGEVWRIDDVPRRQSRN